jgi:hypothetical protein
MAVCSSRQLRYAIHQRFRAAAGRVVHEFPAKASAEAGAVETVLITISITHRFVRLMISKIAYTVAHGSRE